MANQWPPPSGASNQGGDPQHQPAQHQPPGQPAQQPGQHPGQQPTMHATGTGYPANAAAPQAQAAAAAPRRRWPLVAAVFVGMALIAGAVAAFTLTGEAGAEVERRDLGSAGADPFTDPVAPAPSSNLSDFAESDPATSEGGNLAAGEAGYRQAVADVPGVFGGSLDELACDPGQLVEFLNADPTKATLWASVLSIEPADIGPYVGGLTGVNLGYDTRVLDHGLSEGSIVARQALLRRGTAVLIDARGVPRVNCYSGNPLLDPTVTDGESFTGDEWAGFEPTVVVIVIGTVVDQSDFGLIDVASGDVFERPVGTVGNADGGAPPAEETAATTDVAEAGLIELGTPITAQISDEPELRYQIDAPAGSTLTLTVENRRESVQQVATTFELNGEQITFFRTEPDASEQFTHTIDDDGGGIHELIFTEGPAEFTFTVTAESQNDAGQGVDAGEEFASALEITSGQRVEGFVADVDEGDRYLIPTEGAQALVITEETAREADRSAAFTVEINGDQLNFTRAQPGATEVFEVLLGPDDDGMLEILVNEGPGAYAFTVELVDQADGGTGGDASNELPDARPLTDLTAITGDVGERDPGDLYLFDAPSDEFDIEVTVDAASLQQVGVAVIGPDGSRISFFRVEPGVTTTETLTTTAGEGHRLQVTEGRAAYTISIS